MNSDFMASPTVNLFIPCEMDMFSPSIAFSMIQLLERVGEMVFYNPEQTCCGRRFYYAGEVGDARELGNKMMKEFDAKLPIIVPSTACASYIRNHYSKLFENRAVPAEVNLFTQNIFELCHYLVSVRKITKMNNYFNKRVFYYKSCSARNLYRLQDEPETLLRNTEGLDLLIDPTLDSCCSANGHFAKENPEVSDAMLSHIVDKIYSSGAQYVTSTDIHCLQHIDAYIQTNGVGIDVIHIADILNAQYEDKSLLNQSNEL